MSYLTGESIPFRANASCTDQSYDGPYTYAWTFHDGETATGEYVTHTYTTPGNKITTVVVYNESAKTTATATITDTVIAPSYWYDYIVSGVFPNPDMSIIDKPYNEAYNNDLLYATTSSGDIKQIKVPEIAENPEWITSNLNIIPVDYDYSSFVQQGPDAETVCVYTESSTGNLYYIVFNYYDLSSGTPVLIADGTNYIFSDVTTYYVQSGNPTITYSSQSRGGGAKSYYIVELDTSDSLVVGPKLIDTSSVLCLGVGTSSGTKHTIINNSGTRYIWTNGDNEVSTLGNTSISSVIYSLYEPIQQRIILVSSEGTTELINASNGSIVKTGVVTIVGDISISDLVGSKNIYYEEYPYYNFIIVPRDYSGKSYGYIYASYNSSTGELTLTAKYYPVIIDSGDLTIGLYIDKFQTYNGSYYESYLNVITTSDSESSTRISRMKVGAVGLL